MQTEGELANPFVNGWGCGSASRPCAPNPRAKFANHDSIVAASPLRFLIRRALWAIGIVPLLLACAPAAPPVDAAIAVREAEASVAVREIENEGDVAEVNADAELAKPTAASCGPLVWIRSEQEGLARGKAERRPVLVHFATEWCADCKRMVTETFGDPRVKDQAGRFVAVRIDATNDEDPEVSAALFKYSVVNVPTLILLDSTGHERRRITEVIGPDKLLGELARVE